mmetsp:Transcript_16205/g.48883  ORF Transcript_16205/g.48883 Transcript_16205/m.48883 type:complete len:250 (-) Transcript_16205:114-863(-)
MPHKYDAVGAEAPGASTQQPPQPDAGETEGDPLREHASGSKQSFKTTRKLAGKAGKAATKGATKMASALKKGMRRAQAADEEAARGSALMHGDSEDSAGLCDEANGDPRDAGLREDGAMYELPSSSPAAVRREKGASAGASASAVKQPPKGKDPKPCRALQLGSIWDIPTERFPEPLPEPVAKPGDLEAQVIGARQSSLPPLSVSMKGAKQAQPKRAPRRKPCCRRRTKIVLGLLSAATAVGAAIVAAL